LFHTCFIIAAIHTTGCSRRPALLARPPKKLCGRKKQKARNSSPGVVKHIARDGVRCYTEYRALIKMKKELLKYLSGLCQAASAALLAAALIMPAVTTQALWGASVTAIVGAVLVVLREKGE
jgi:hypothetical protein